MKLQHRAACLHGSALSRYHLDIMLDYMWDTSRKAAVHPSGGWRPPMDVCQTEREVLVLVELAGMDEDLIEVTLFDDVLLLTGERRPDMPRGEGLTYHEAGIRYGRFHAEVYLPYPVDADAAEARYESGLLRIRLPKRTVTVRAEPEEASRSES